MKKSQVRIRQATGADAALLARLGAQTFHATYAADVSAADMAAFLEASFGPEKQAAEVADASTFFLIAEDGDTPIGYAKWQAGEAPAGDVASPAVELARIYVVREWIGRGVGSTLMQAGLSEAERRGYETVWLGVWEKNQQAIAFYRKWGFAEAGSQPFQLGAEQHTDVLMQRKIGGRRGAEG